LRRLIDMAAAAAVAAVARRKHGRLEGAFADLERDRLACVAREWLELERARPPFEVSLREHRMTLFAGGLRLEGRVDRVDRLLDARGGLAVIDYKSGQAKVADWLGARPDDAQLPLYALTVGAEEVRAVAFARLKVGERGFVGLARDRGVLPGVAALEDHRHARALASDWPDLIEQWREELDALGDGYAGGDARVDPKRGLATCRLCDLAALCRVHERLVGVGVDDPAEDLA
jgi:RecB family exonuclease